MLLGCIYRPGDSGQKYNEKLNLSIRKATQLVNKQQYSGLVLAGDFNFSEISWSDEGTPIEDLRHGSIYQNFVETVNDCFLHQCVKEPTFESSGDRTRNILDLIFTDSAHRVYAIDHGPPLG